MHTCHLGSLHVCVCLSACTHVCTFYLTPHVVPFLTRRLLTLTTGHTQHKQTFSTRPPLSSIAFQLWLPRVAWYHHSRPTRENLSINDFLNCWCSCMHFTMTSVVSWGKAIYLPQMEKTLDQTNIPRQWTVILFSLVSITCACHTRTQEHNVCLIFMPDCSSLYAAHFWA